MNKLALIFTLTLALISTQSLATGDVAQGKAKSVTCIGCHGV
ncbi:MAG: cytochrome c4, partial [Gammaproteobacteria bacterium]|nr:cytochrome c4 [Gammaproteobacteria bacterium]